MTENNIDSRIAKLMGEKEARAYSIDINAALGVAQKMEERGFDFKLKDLRPKKINGNLWRAVLKTPSGAEFAAQDENPALAICLTVLKTVDAT
ncbi:MAG: hypothetical protein SVS15_07735 [Thermodesulfobacteriota bacterium]|nr:hypothetical protein [Thermodesulfobacteriota bacterium]